MDETARERPSSAEGEMLDLRIATYNVENLFGRAKVFVDAPNLGFADGILGMIDELRGLLRETNYTELRKQRMLELYLDEDLKQYIEVREDRGKLWKRSGPKVVGVAADGAKDWDGTIVFKRAEFSDLARINTAKVIKATKADVLCIVEAEDRPTLKDFDAHLLGYRYGYEMLIDGNDQRGIDVGLYSRFPIGRIETHIFDGTSRSRTFSRDCLEVEVQLPDGKPLFLLLNHLKSKGYDWAGTADERRKKQATRVTEILGKHRLTKERVVIAGDLNDTPTSAPLQPLLGVYALHDVLELKYGSDMSKRWTYRYDSFDQIDYLLVSRPLKSALKDAGVIRQGIFGLEDMTSQASGSVTIEKEYDSVTAYSNQASDHGAVWARFEL